MSDSVVKIDGVNIDSAPVFMQDCSFPITDFANCCDRDDVLDNFPIHIGHWPKNTKAPAISKRRVKVKTPAASTDDCLPGYPKISVDLETCELLAPNMVKIGGMTGDLNYEDLLEDFCYRRRVLPEQICVFDNNGNLAPGNAVSQVFIEEAMSIVFQTLAAEVGRAALVGDDAVTNPMFQPTEFNGFYTQLKSGWDPSAGTPCPATYNLATTIDWKVLTGVATTNASPEDRTIAGQTVTVHGTVYNVPVGLNLPDFLDRLWIDKMEQKLECVGGVTSWEMHAPLGFRACFLRAEACMRPCATCLNSIDQRILDLYQASITSKFATLLTGRSFPILETRHVATNELYFGPRTVGGRPTYGLFFDDQNRFYGRGPVINSRTAGYGNPWTQANSTSLVRIPSKELESTIEDRAIHWDLTLRGDCVSGFMKMKAGVITCSRNAWLRVINVACPTFIEACPTIIDIIP